MSEKISIFHDDSFVPSPEETGSFLDYKDYPERGGDPVATRAEQLGEDIPTIEEVAGKKIQDFSQEEYGKLVAESIKERYHVIVSSVFDKYVFPNPENPSDNERLEKLKKVVEYYGHMEAKCGVNLIRRSSDFKESGANLVLGLEAGAHLIRSMDDLKKLIGFNIKLFGLQYGKDTPLATNSDGLTKLGREGVLHLFDNDLIVDLAHSGAKTRQDVMDLAEDREMGHLVSYTHGCEESDIIDSWKGRTGERALRHKEVKRLVKMGGIVGLGVTKPFFSSAEEIAQRINETAQLDGGIDALGIGTDFGGVPNVFLNEIRSPKDMKILADILSESFGMSDTDIDKVLRKNAQDWIGRAIK